MNRSLPNQSDVTSGQRRDLRGELDRLQSELADLKVKYEQYFTGILPFAPAAEHQKIIRTFRSLKKAPFKSSATAFHLRSIESRYQTYNTYWQRVIREKEEGRYRKDLFKSALREKSRHKDALSKTAAGVAEQGMRDLFAAYTHALSSTSGDLTGLTYDRFKESLIKTAHAFSEKNPGRGVKFKIISQAGRVTIRLVPS